MQNDMNHVKMIKRCSLKISSRLQDTPAMNENTKGKDKEVK
jgi:hypothetical protein